MKRNVTIALDEETARWARIEAARRDTSMSDFVGSLLRARMQDERSYEDAMRTYLAASPQKLKRGGAYPKRGEVHERGIR